MGEAATETLCRTVEVFPLYTLLDLLTICGAEKAIKDAFLRRVLRLVPYAQSICIDRVFIEAAAWKAETARKESGNEDCDAQNSPSCLLL